MRSRVSLWSARNGKLRWVLCSLPKLIRSKRAAFEIVALAAGRLGSLSLAAQSIIMTADQSKPLYLFVPRVDVLYTEISAVVLNTIPFGIGMYLPPVVLPPAQYIVRRGGIHSGRKPHRCTFRGRRQTSQSCFGISQRRRRCSSHGRHASDQKCTT